MARRQIIQIDEDLCDGCGDCVPACQEGALQIIDGKARLVKDIFCDGLGACLGECPKGALAIEEREAEEYDEAAVTAHLAAEQAPPAVQPPVAPMPHGGGCSGSALRQFGPAEGMNPGVTAPASGSQLGHWPVQLMLVPPQAPFLKDTDLLICADCVPFAVPGFHDRYLAGRAVLVGCPKLDNLEFYFEKLQQVFAAAGPRRIMVLKMEVPCCNGIAQIALDARERVCPNVPTEVHTIGVQGGIESAMLPCRSREATE